MFRLIVNMEVVNPVTEEGIVENRADSYVKGYQEAHQVLDQVLEMMGVVDDSDPDFPGHP